MGNQVDKVTAFMFLDALKMHRVIHPNESAPVAAVFQPCQGNECRSERGVWRADARQYLCGDCELRRLRAMSPTGYHRTIRLGHQATTEEDTLYCHLCEQYKPRSLMGLVACLECENG